MQEKSNGLFGRLSRLLGMAGGAGEVTAPEVTWLALPPYDIPGMAVVSGLLVENQGSADAEDVYISLTYPSERFITHMEVISDDPYDLDGGTPRDSYITLRLTQLRAGGRVVVYVAGHITETPEVVVAVQAQEA